MNTHIKTTFAAAAGLTLAASSASAALLLDYSFDGTDDNTALTSDGWVGSSTFKTSGKTFGSNSQHVMLAMPSVVADGAIDGGIYTLSVDLVGPGWASGGAGSQYMGMGFTSGLGDSSGSGHTPTNSIGRMEIKSYGGYNAKAVGETSSVASDIGDFPFVSQTVSVQLNTTDDTNYTVEFFWGAQQLGTTYDVGVQAIDQIYLTLERPTGNTDDIYFDNVSLTGPAVPEPTTTALLGLGGLALILRRRK